MRAWSPASEDKLRRLYGREPVVRLAFLLKRTAKAVRSRAKVLGIKTGKVHRWTPAELKLLRQRYPHEKTEHIACDLGMPVKKVWNCAKRYGLEKTAAYLASPDACRLRRGNGAAAVGFKYRFQKGGVPANKGLRRPGWSVGRGRMQETQFKKGQRGNKWVPIGTERINTDGYIDRKIREDRVGANNWRPLHRIIWEATHGPVPRGHLVAFKDGDKLNCVLENLELMTKADNARRNAVWRRMPKELADIVMLRGAINRQINKREGRAKENNRERREATRRAVRNARRAARQGKPDGHRSREGGRPGC